MIRKTLLPLLLITTGWAFAQSTSTTVTNIDSATYFLQKGLEEKKIGRRMESLKNFEKASYYDNSNKVILNELAVAYHDLRKFTLSKNTYKKMVELGDGSASTCKQLMLLSFNMRQHEDVLLYANRLKQADPNERVSYYIGKVQYDQENYGEAVKTLIDASIEDPLNGEVLYMIARSYADMQNYKQSVPYFQKAITLDPVKTNWIYELALIYYAIHDDKNALKYMLEAGEKGYRKDNEYLENLGVAYLNIGDLENGVKILGEILNRKPSDMNILNMIAEAYYYKGRYQQAMDYWDKILIYDKANASALYMIGMCYQKKGGRENNEKGIVTTMTLGNNRPIESGFSVEKRQADSVQVVWFIIEKLKWYPWEKFYGMVAADMKGPVMDSSLQLLKVQVQGQLGR
jgi:tetratricopeptide (TPR) repeat protein